MSTTFGCLTSAATRASSSSMSTNAFCDARFSWTSLTTTSFSKPGRSALQRELHLGHAALADPGDQLVPSEPGRTTGLPRGGHVTVYPNALYAVRRRTAVRLTCRYGAHHLDRAASAARDRAVRHAVCDAARRAATPPAIIALVEPRCGRADLTRRTTVRAEVRATASRRRLQAGGSQQAGVGVPRSGRAAEGRFPAHQRGGRRVQRGVAAQRSADQPASMLDRLSGHELRDRHRAGGHELRVQPVGAGDRRERAASACSMPKVRPARRSKTRSGRRRTTTRARRCRSSGARRACRAARHERRGGIASWSSAIAGATIEDVTRA